MRTELRSRLKVLLFLSVLASGAWAWGTDLPAGLPDPLAWRGAPVETREAWDVRREEMKATLLQGEYGAMPPVPAVSVADQTEEAVPLPGLAEPALKIMATLAFGPEDRLNMQACLWLPGGRSGPVPVILAIEPVWWEDPFQRRNIVQQLLQRGYGFAGFDHNALASYEDPGLRAACEVYPGYDWGTVGVAAWGCSVTMNWLEALPGADRQRVAVWGHSRRGKSALLAGALDARFGAVLSHMSGMGGSALYRVRGDGAQRLEQLLERYWLQERIFGYNGREHELPFDQHWLHALVAPRPLYIRAGLRDAWGNPDGERAAVEAARPVYAWLGHPDNLEIDLADVEHVDPNGPEGGASWEATMNFLDRHFGPPAGGNSTVLVGVSYFAGWWEPLPNKWHDADGNDWRPGFPGRLPLLGEYNTRETMDREIVAAAEHGVDYFSILWYYNPPGTEREPNSRFLSRGLENFMASPKAHRMKFMLEFCNHPPYDVTSDAAWEECVALWTRCMAHPSYLRVNGRPVFKVHGGHYFLAQNGNDPDRCHARLDRLRGAARDQGLGELSIGCGVGAHELIGPDHPAARLFDFTGTYMDLPPLPRRIEDYPYRDLDAFISEGRSVHAGDVVPYLPFIGAGWAPHPWPDQRACFALPKDTEWEETLRRLAADLAAHPKMGFPGASAFTIYAWNEFGEGGFIAPTAGEGYSRLEAIRRVFGGEEDVSTPSVLQN